MSFKKELFDGIGVYPNHQLAIVIYPVFRNYERESFRLEVQAVVDRRKFHPQMVISKSNPKINNEVHRFQEEPISLIEWQKVELGSLPVIPCRERRIMGKAIRNYLIGEIERPLAYSKAPAKLRSKIVLTVNAKLLCSTPSSIASRYRSSLFRSSLFLNWF